MASTFTLKTAPYGSGRYMQLYCEQKKDVATNKSTITWTLTSAGGTSNYFSTGPTTVKINGTQVYYVARKDYTTEVFPAAKGSVSGTIDVYHDDDGNKTINVSLSTAIYVGTVSTYSDNWQLDSNPRKALLTATPEEFTDTDNPTIWYSNPAKNAVESLQACISFTGAMDDIKYRNVDVWGDHYTFPLTEEERNVLRNNTPLKGREIIFFLRTIISGITYYSTWNRWFVVSESEQTKPTVSINYTLNNSSLPEKFKDICIQGKSRLGVTLTAQGKYNASIVSSWVDIDSRRYGTNSFTTDVLPLDGIRTLTAYVIDTREHQNSDSKTIEVIPYKKPFLTPISKENAILCYRSDGNGKKIGNSTSVWVKVEKGYSPITTTVQNNYCALQYRYKKSTVAWNDENHKWMDLIPRDSSNNIYDAQIPDVVFDLKTSYTVQIMAIDDLGEYDFKTFDIPTQDVALHLGRGGKNVSVGSYCDYSENYTFHSEWKAIFDNGMHGTLISQAVDDILAFALTCGQGVTPIHTTTQTANLPSTSGYDYSSGFVQKRSNSEINVYLTNYSNGDIAVNVYLNNAWKGWKFLRLQ